MLTGKDVTKAKKARKRMLKRFYELGRIILTNTERAQIIGFADMHVMRAILDTDSGLCAALRSGIADAKAELAASWRSQNERMR